MASRPSRATRIAIHTLLAVPFVGTLWVPFYNAAEPTLLGFPYFYWYQFAWIPIGAVINAVAYFVLRERREDEPSP